MRTLVIATALAVSTAGLAAVAAPAQAGVPWLVTVKASATQVTLGQTVTFTGKVTPKGAAHGKKVVLQEKLPGKSWKDQVTDKINANGGYKVADKPTVNKARQYRVVMAATNAHKKAISSAVTVKVYGWDKLTDHTAVNANGLYAWSSVNLNGKSYADSISTNWTGDAFIEYNLDHLCTALKGTFGINDDSETGAQATVSAESDGTQIYAHTFDVGQTESKKLTLDSPLKLRLNAESVVDGASGYGAIGSPKVLCTR